MKKYLIILFFLLMPIIVFAKEVKFEDLPNVPPSDNSIVIYDSAERVFYREIKISYKGDIFIYQIQGVDEEGYFIIMPYPLEAIIDGIKYILIHRDPPSYRTEE
jgi:hypothetical protein